MNHLYDEVAVPLSCVTWKNERTTLFMVLIMLQ